MTRLRHRVGPAVISAALSLVANARAQNAQPAPSSPAPSSPAPSSPAPSSPAPIPTLVAHADVLGAQVDRADVRAPGGAWKSVAWSDLDRAVVPEGRADFRFRIDAGAGAALEVPPCAGRRGVRVDGRSLPAPDGPLVTTLSAGSHEVVVSLDISRYERRVACGEPPRVGESVTGFEGIGTLRFASPHGARGGGAAVVYVPRGHDVHRPAPVLVGTHPWNGSMWTYVAYDELLSEAQRKDVVLLMPQGLGNSLYTADAEDEVLRAIDALSASVAVNARAVSIWGASMGGAGATTISFHHPDHFAMAASFFGDSRYDRSTYAGLILRSDAAAHAVNALDVVDNARHLPVWLIHGEQDRTSKIEQSEMLADAMREKGYDVRFDRIADAGHAGALVARFLRAIVDAAAAARIPDRVTRVTYRSVRPSDAGAYGVAIERSSSAGDAFIDLEQSEGVVRVHHADGVRRIRVARGALGTDPERPPPIVFDGTVPHVDVQWQGR